MDLIKNSGDEGILQSELWKMIDADSREGSRAMLRLERKKLVIRDKELHQGRWTYRVKAKYRYASVDSIIDLPCSFCNLESRCSSSGLINPVKCEQLTIWLKEKTEK